MPLNRQRIPIARWVTLIRSQFSLSFDSTFSVAIVVVGLFCSSPNQAMHIHWTPLLLLSLPSRTRIQLNCRFFSAFFRARCTIFAMTIEALSWSRSADDARNKKSISLFGQWNLIRYLCFVASLFWAFVRLFFLSAWLSLWVPADSEPMANPIMTKTTKTRYSLMCVVSASGDRLQFDQFHLVGVNQTRRVVSFLFYISSFSFRSIPSSQLDYARCQEIRINDSTAKSSPHFIFVPNHSILCRFVHLISGQSVMNHLNGQQTREMNSSEWKTWKKTRTNSSIEINY